MRFHFVDRITELEPGRKIAGYKLVSMVEPYFDTHFPGFPVYPGVFVIEAMAQLAGLLIELTPGLEPPPRKALLSIVDKVKLRRMVRPGDTLELSAVLLALDEDGARAEVVARVAGEEVTTTRLTFALLHVPAEFAPRLQEERASLLRALQPAPVSFGTPGVR
jgi:3-hydroxyacyl-[acyl-carrier-protein] dehydratase